MTEQELNKWFESLPLKQKNVVLAGYTLSINVPKSKMVETDEWIENNEEAVKFWNTYTLSRKAEFYFHSFHEQDFSKIHDEDVFLFSKYEDKVDFLDVDKRMRWQEQSLMDKWNALDEVKESYVKKMKGVSTDKNSSSLKKE